MVPQPQLPFVLDQSGNHRPRMGPQGESHRAQEQINSDPRGLGAGIGRAVATSASGLNRARHNCTRRPFGALTYTGLSCLSTSRRPCVAVYSTRSEVDSERLLVISSVRSRWLRSALGRSLFSGIIFGRSHTRDSSGERRASCLRSFPFSAHVYRSQYE